MEMQLAVGLVVEDVAGDFFGERFFAYDALEASAMPLAGEFVFVF